MPRSAGPALDEACALDMSLRSRPSPSKCSRWPRRLALPPLALVLHVADEFATSELKPELDNPGALTELRAQIEIDPKVVLDDASVTAADHPGA